MLFVTGLALMVASGTVFFRDIEHLLAVILFPLFFATPVLWDFTAQGLTGTTEKALYFGNPVTPFVDAFRTNFYEPSWIGMGTWVFMIVAAAVSLLLGAWLFSRLYDELATEL